MQRIFRSATKVRMDAEIVGIDVPEDERSKPADAHGRSARDAAGVLIECEVRGRVPWTSGLTIVVKPDGSSQEPLRSIGYL
jgi:hypothetical protein